MRMSEESTLSQVGRSPVVLFLGALVGAVLVLAGFAALFWVESKAISKAASLEHGSSTATTVSADKVDPTNEGKLVHLTGQAATKDTVTDPDFNISTNGLRLAREV